MRHDPIDGQKMPLKFQLLITIGKLKLDGRSCPISKASTYTLHAMAPRPYPFQVILRSHVQNGRVYHVTKPSFLGFDVRVLLPDGSEAEEGEMGDLCVKLPLPPGCGNTLWKNQEGYDQAYLSQHPGMLCNNYYERAVESSIGQVIFTRVMLESRTEMDTYILCRGQTT